MARLMGSEICQIVVSSQSDSSIVAVGASGTFVVDPNREGVSAVTRLGLFGHGNQDLAGRSSQVRPARKAKVNVVPLSSRPGKQRIREVVVEVGLVRACTEPQEPIR